jgi:Bacterial SH3 domain
MRCPECTVRNSVAAVQCKDCGAKLPKKKAFPKDLAIAAGAFGLVGLAAFGGISMLPALFDTEGNLQKLAKRMAQGPKSPEEAGRMKTDLEAGLRAFLEHNSELPSAELAARLQKILPAAAFEVHVAVLPENLRLVEVDTILQVSNFIVSKKHVAVLRDFDIYDTAAVIPEGAGKTMVLLGHGNMQEGRKPQVRLFTVEADGVKEKSQKAVPSFTGEGSAVLQKNGKDINMELSLASRGVEEKLFIPGSYRAAGVLDESVRPRLVYRNGAYELIDDNGKSPLAALRAAAFVAADPSQKDRFRRYFSPGAQDNLAGIGKVKLCPPSFQIKRKGSTAAVGAEPEGSSSGGHHRHRHRHQAAQAAPAGGFVFVIGNTDDAFEVVIAKDGGIYQTKQIRRVKALPALGEVEVASVSSTYEDKTSNLVDKLLSVPDGHSADHASDGAATGSSAANGSGAAGSTPTSTGATPLGQGSGARITVKATSSQALSTDKIVEKKADAEHGTVSNKIDTPTVKVRRGASTVYRTIAEVPRGGDLEIIGKKDGWYKVRVEGREGFVYGGFVNCTTNDAYTTATVRRDKSVKDDNNHTVSHAKAGERIVVLGGGHGDKFKVQLASGRVGYVDKDVLDMGGGADSAGGNVSPSSAAAASASGSSSSSSSSHSGASSHHSSATETASEDSGNSNDSDDSGSSRHRRSHSRHSHRHSSRTSTASSTPPPFVP